MTVDDIRKALKDRRMDIVSNGTGLSTRTISNIRDKVVTNPSNDTVTKLTDYLEGRNAKGGE